MTDWRQKTRIWHSGRECRTTIARVSRDVRATCMRTPGEFWSIGDKNEHLTFRARGRCRASIARVSYDNRASVARHSRFMYASSRRTLAICTAIFVRHTQMCCKVLIQCDSNWKLSLIRVFSCNFVSPTTRQQSQPSEIPVVYTHGGGGGGVEEKGRKR